MLKARVAVLVSGGGTNLQAILDAQSAGKLPHAEVVLVVANRPDAYALERARNAEVATAVVTKKEYGEAFEAKLTETLEQVEADIIVLAGFMTILSAQFTNHFAGRILNVHPSLIPAFCGQGFYGLKVHEAALQAGVKVTGATVHYVNEIPDGGEIIAQKAVNVLEGDTPEILQKRVMQEAEWILLPEAVELVGQKIVSKRSQS